MKEQDKLIKIGREVAKVLKELKEVKAIAFYGAIAIGFADKYSDIDIKCLCNKIPKPKSRIDILKKLNWVKIIEQGKKYDLFRYKNNNFGVEFTQLDYILKKIRKAQQAGYLGRDDDLTVAWTLNTKIIWDPIGIYKKQKNIIKRLKKKSKYPIKILWPQLLHLEGEWPKGVGIETALKRKNDIWLNKLLQICLDRYIQCLYLFNNRHYTDFSQKWAFKEISQFKIKPKNCIKRLERISILGNKSKELREKIRMLQGLINETDKLIR